MCKCPSDSGNPGGLPLIRRVGLLLQGHSHFEREFMELYDVMRSTFAAREFTGESVGDEVLFRILENARFAPSGGNRQAARVVIVRDKSTRAHLAELSTTAAKRYWAQMLAGETPWNSLNPPGPTPDEIDATEPPTIFTDPLVDCDVVLVICADLNEVAALDQNLDRVGIVGGGSVYPFVWNVLLGARREGLGGTLTTMAVAREPEVKALLGLPDSFAVCAVVPIGKPVKQLSKLRRNSVSSFTACERWGNPGLDEH